MSMWMEDKSFYWCCVNAKPGKYFWSFEFSEALTGFCEDHSVISNVSALSKCWEGNMVEGGRVWVGGLQAWGFPADHCTWPQCMEYVDTALEWETCCTGCWAKGKSLPLVNKDTMKPIFSINKPPWAQLAGRAYNKAVSPSLLSFLLDFAF